MLHTDTDPPEFKSGSLVPAATYLLLVAVLSGLMFVSASESPPPLLGMLWGIFLIALTIGAFKVEGVSPRSILPSVRTLVPAIGVLIAFWTLYNLVAFTLALGGVPGFEVAWSRTVAHPISYALALFSAFLFTALPEELVFRGYLQQKITALAGGGSRRAIAAGIVVVAILFALFHLPRWFFASGHGVGTALIVRLSGLTLMGLTYGAIYALTRNLWLVVLFHATMNQPPFLVTQSVPADLHLVVAVVEYAAMVSVVYLAVRVTDPDEFARIWSPQKTASATSD